MFSYKRIKVVFSVLMLLLSSSTAIAAPQWCSGKIGYLWIYSDGGVFIRPSWRGDHVQICNINQNHGQITPQTCAGWLTFLRNAVTNQEATIIYYSDAPACQVMPTYGSAPIPGYIMLVD